MQYMDPKDIPYEYKVNTARSFLRKRDFLTYASQLIPFKLGSETWSLAWAYIREVDDIIDSPHLEYEERRELLEREWSVVKDSFDNSFKIEKGDPLRYVWLNQFVENEEKFYEGKLRPYIFDLYESAKIDVERRNRILSRGAMKVLLDKKAGSFFKLFFGLSGFDLGPYLNEVCYLLGVGLGVLDDALDFAEDLKSGYVNASREELMDLGIDLVPEDRNFIKKLIERGYYTYKSKEIMRMLIRARVIARKFKNKTLRNVILRLSEIFAAPILEGRFIPGQKYIFKGGRILDKLLPKNETLAYKIGHPLIHMALKFPQVPESMFRKFFNL
ncbi:MAG: hypothetical protein ACTSYT_02640 [Candidatus Asgardarchaeia archaeon]